MKGFRNFGRLEPKVVSAVIVIAIAASLIIGFRAGAEWGAVVTALASSILTVMSLSITWSDRNETLRPRVIFYADRVGDDVLLKLSNVGLRPAFDVRVTLEKKILFRLGDKDWTGSPLSDTTNLIGFLKGPIAYLAPSQTLTSLNRLGTGNQNSLEETAVQRFLLPENEDNHGTITYRDQNGRSYVDSTVLGFAAFENMKLVTTVRRSSVAAAEE